MTPLRFKKEVEFEKGKTYSVCLRGARRYETNDEFDLSLYTPECWEKPKEIANIVSQKQLRFSDMGNRHCLDNYDNSAQSWEGLLEAMNNIYSDFEMNEIVTLLRFEVV